MRTAEEIVQARSGSLICVSPVNTIRDALQLMVKHSIGAVLVKEGERIIGIWTERDLVRNMASEGFDPDSARVGDHMTTRLNAAPHTATVDLLTDRFLGLRHRHLLIEKEGEFIGFLSAGDVMREGLLAKDTDLKKLNATVSWEYYEDWKWKHKR